MCVCVYIYICVFIYVCLNTCVCVYVCLYLTNTKVRFFLIRLFPQAQSWEIKFVNVFPMEGLVSRKNKNKKRSNKQPHKKQKTT